MYPSVALHLANPKQLSFWGIPFAFSMDVCFDVEVAAPYKQSLLTLIASLLLSDLKNRHAHTLGCDATHWAPKTW